MPKARSPAKGGLLATPVLVASALLCCAGALGCDHRQRGGDAAPPGARSVFLIILDAASASYFGAYGDPHGTSPHIDHLARESVVFENAYSQSASTPPSTASLLTGVRGSTHGMTGFTKLPPRLHTLPQLLARSGYRTFAVTGNPLAVFELARGYDRYIRAYNLPELREKRAREEMFEYTVTLPEDINHQVFDLLPEFVGSKFFAYIHYLQPHFPYDPPEPHRKEFDPHGEGITWDDLHEELTDANAAGRASPATIERLEARYRANIQYVDSAVGELLERLEREGLYEESLIVLMSDHGDAFFKHRRFGHSGTLYDDMTRIPLVIKPPGSRGNRPRRIANLVETIDVVPTIFDCLGIPLSDQFEGDSLWPLIAGETHHLAGAEVVTATVRRTSDAIRIDEYKYIRSSDGAEELYDLRGDADEQRNLIEAERDKGLALRTTLDSLVRRDARRPVRDARPPAPDPRMKRLLERLGYVDGQVSDDASSPGDSP
jgi:arylsulfatase A-like enzyme